MAGNVCSAQAGTVQKVVSTRQQRPESNLVSHCHESNIEAQADHGTVAMMSFSWQRLRGNLLVVVHVVRILCSACLWKQPVYHDGITLTDSESVLALPAVQMHTWHCPAPGQSAVNMPSVLGSCSACSVVARRKHMLLT